MKPAKISAETIAALRASSAARVTHGKAQLRASVDRFVMEGPSGSHSLAIDATDAVRLDAHWRIFATHSLNG
jgi:hypothetical protein